jgi:DNA-binding transcriptional LysR family regulator
METRELRYFIAVAEELHFGRAAKRVGIEQSPLSKAIAEMERRLGLRLFVRTRRGTRLTPAGEILLKDARQIMVAVNQARRNMLSIASGHRGQLRIAVSGGLASWRLARLLIDSRREDPGVEVQITHSPFLTQLQELCSGELDMGFTLSPSKDPQLRCVPLWNDSMTGVMRRDHPLSERPSILQLGREVGTLILIGDRSEHGQGLIVDQFLLAQQQIGPIEFVANFECLLTLVSAGYGVGLVAAGLSEQICAPDLVVRPIDICGAKITTFLLQRHSEQSNVVARFIERARKIVERE